MFKSITTFIQDKYWKLKSAPRCALAQTKNLLNQHHYHLLSETELKATRISDTAFIFGSGYSINNITPAQWRYIAQHNTVSFREFPRQNFIRADYHITGEVDFLEPYAQHIRENLHYQNTIFIVQKGWSAYMGNNLIGKKLLLPNARIFRFRRIGRSQYIPPSNSFSTGIVHGFNSSLSVTNFAYLMGWKHIVLAGIDLNDKRYFWLKPDETRAYEKKGMGITYQSVFTNADQIVPLFEYWTKILSEERVQLYTLNPKSLLADVMPIYQIPQEAASTAHQTSPDTNA
jgi:hypothetical protein